MKSFTLVLLIFLSFNAHPFTGSGVAGGVTLSGMLKSALVRTAIPLGGVSAFYGYEAFNFPQSTPVYCYGGMGITSGHSLIGVSLGGQFNRLKTFGKCSAPKDYEGGFLTVGLNYNFKGAGAKSIGLTGAVNIGFDLKLFNERIQRALSTDERKIKSRMYSVVWHLAKYAGRVSSQKIKDNHILKLLLLPLLPAYGENWKSGLKSLKMDLASLKKFKNPNEFLDLKERVRELFYQIRKDPDFYKCSKDRNCMDIYVDAYSVFDAIEEAIAECHSVVAGLAPSVGFDVNVPFLESNFSYSYSYSYYGLQKSLPRDSSIDLASSQTFAAHRFSKKSSSCANVEKTAAGSFADLLIILGIGG